MKRPARRWRRRLPATGRSGPSGGRAREAGGLSGLLEAFSCAAERFPSERVRQSLFFAGRPAVLDVVGLALFERIAPTFAHLRASPTTDTPITLSVWDQALTGVPAPPFTNDAELLWKRPDWTLSSHSDRGAHRCLREARPGRVACLDRLTNQLVVAYDSARGVSLHEQGRPVARVIAQLYRGLGVQRAHAGLVALGDSGALLVGGSGSGKTTLALDCLMGGLDFLADDVAGLEPASGGAFAGHSIYGAANVLPFHLRRHPGLVPHARRDGSQDKGLLLPVALVPDRISARTRITTILVPRISDATTTRIRPFRRRDALPLLVPATPEHVHAGFSDDDGARLAQLVKSVRCHRIEPGADPREVAASVRALLERSRD